MRVRVEKAIERLTPAMGVNIIELVDVQDGVVSVRLFPSACSAGMAPQTMLNLVEEQLQDEVPEIKQVLLVED